MENTLILNFDPDQKKAKYLEESGLVDGRQVQTVQSFEEAKKFLKDTSFRVAVVLVNITEEHQKEGEKVAKFLRRTQKNNATRLMVLTPLDPSIWESKSYQQLGANVFLSCLSTSTESLLHLVQSELNTYKIIQKKDIQKEAEVGLLTTLARFSRMELGANECFEEFCKTISLVSGSTLSYVWKVGGEEQLERQGAPFKGDDVLSEEMVEEYQKAFCDSIMVKKSFLESSTQISVDPDIDDHKTASEKLGRPIGGSMAFPLKCYNKPIAIIQCLYDQEQLGNISIQQVEIIEKSAEQFSVLLERQRAEEKLQSQYQRLQKTMKELSSTQEQLFHSEKMASLGQMAAGLAHEINNPLAFIMSNFTSLDDYVDSMTTLLEQHTAFMAHLDQNNKDHEDQMRASLNEMHQGLDLNFMIDDVRSLVKESQDGLCRVKEIINNLRQFSRIDNDEEDAIDIHQGIESTLTILKHQLKQSDIELIKDYGDLPEISCNLGLLNQVFINILHNGIQALGPEGKILIKTSLSEEQKVEIVIRDNGKGIPESVIGKIFDPFFTTKPVGEGTGLGLSLCYTIIEKMNGELSVESQENEFTEFTIRLPA